ncbi:TonB-dependent receptor [Ferruginibacter sp. SUN002]|uniref:TonB-dependent receptor n=1 Tax=Ferruginibacter sp. SUN002 TaxID=2937789 RepID=UPI003D35CCB6
MKKLFLSSLLLTGIVVCRAQKVKSLSDTTTLTAVEVSAIRASDNAPFTKTNLSKKSIEKNNIGQDLPFLLNQTPAVVISSDAGNGVGYTGIRIRGTDATRINVTLNGIPYNDAESGGVYFVDMPDIASSTNSIQIQRGVGTSSNGTGAFGSTISISTNELNAKAYGEINNNFGSFNTWKNTVKAGTGLINNRFTVDARLSRLSSDGYIDRASSDLQSLYLSGAYIRKKSTLRFNILSGKEKTYQAWNGVPDYLLESDRTNNSSGTEKPGTPYDNETDNYTQTHYQLFYTRAINSKWNFNTAAFLTRGLGYYENYKGDQKFSKYGLPNLVIRDTTIKTTDVIRQKWLDNYFYGQTFALQYQNAKNAVTIGGGWTVYDGIHHGNLIWSKNGGIDNDYEYYHLKAIKSDINIYTKWQHHLSTRLAMFADLQYRHVQHEMNGFQDHPELDVNRKFNFVNPKLGLTYNSNDWQYYFSYALGNKEPNRDDFEAGIINQPKKETLHDFEAGIEKKNTNYSFGATAYYMLYKDQLVLTGQLNDVGAYTRVNVPNSYRLGVELQGAYVVSKKINAAANIALSSNKIKKFTQYIDEYDANWEWLSTKDITYSNTSIAFSPSVVGAATINILPYSNLEFSLISKYVGKQYLDNTQTDGRSLDAFYTQDVRGILTLKNLLFKEWNIHAQVSNLFNTKYEPNGATYPAIVDGAVVNGNYYYPMAGTTFNIGINIKL